MILDGQHRSCCMLMDRGENYMASAVRIFFLPCEGSLFQRVGEKIRFFVGLCLYRGGLAVEDRHLQGYFRK